MSDETTVFGIVREHHADHPYKFIQVFATLKGNELHLLQEPEKDFPKRGDVHVGHPLPLPADGAAVLCDVEFSGAEENAFTVTRFRKLQPIEIVELRAPSTRQHEVREQLLRGTVVSYLPTTRVLFRLTDGVLIGPFSPLCEAESSASHRNIRCKPEDLIHRVGLWRDASVLALAALGRQARTFSRFVELPTPTDKFDCADLSTWVSSILKRLKSESLASINRAQLRTLSQLAATAPLPDDLESRRLAVSEALEAAAFTSEQTERIARALAASSILQSELDEIRAETRREAEQAFQLERQEEKAEGEKLGVRIRHLRDEIEALERKRVSAKHDIDAQVDTALKRIGERITEIEASPTELLAHVGLMRSMLPASTSSDAEHAIRKEKFSAESAEQLETVHVASAALRESFQGLGIAETDAAIIAEGTLAAALAGQLCSFSGNSPRIFVDTAARAISAPSWSTLEIPAGLLRGQEFGAAFNGNTENSEEAGESLLAVLNLNLSALEAYAGVLLHMLGGRRQCYQGSPPILLGSLASGAAAIPIGSQHLELGPIFDTRYCRYAWPPPPAGRRRLGAIVPDRWLTWIAEIGAHSIASPPKSIWLRGDVAPNPGWDVNLWRAYQVLDWMGSEHPLAVLLVGWCVPRALHEKLDPEQMTDLIAEADVDLEQKPYRWAKRMLLSARDSEE